MNGSLFAVNALADSPFFERAQILKEAVELNKSDDQSSSVIIGKDFTISEKEIEIQARAYKLNDNENPDEAAIKHLMERKVLLNKATELGYTVTDEEIDNQIALINRQNSIIR